ncbi:hypothetical protein KUTG_10000 [Kutzneria sp. 744]|nr:hypothetical protein KUTG_10000 [Kutzneria sp. 744]
MTDTPIYAALAAAYLHPSDPTEPLWPTEDEARDACARNRPHCVPAGLLQPEAADAQGAIGPSSHTVTGAPPDLRS